MNRNLLIKNNLWSPAALRFVGELAEQESFHPLPAA
jgi:hypothetical protein